ncbi:PREDICTED: secretoglobin family 1D member 2-like [Crocodylus porosus]|uniref:secretoglobin family 1D member 2-like n=1 Tax=Crocodylus porosus TaxID=8502 RepID=UPI00093EC819|nr:PREDICTED: secretoglobin family 1D member 2-like [Crocodylus porosus]
MKLTFVLLVTLALCCYSATAETCPVLVDVISKFLFASRDQLLEAIAPFVTDPTMEKAGLELKECALAISKDHSDALKELMVNILKVC